MKQIRPLSILKNKQQETHCLLLLEVPGELDELLSDRVATPTELIFLETAFAWLPLGRIERWEKHLPSNTEGT